MTAETDLLPLPEMDIYTLGSGVGLRDVCHTPVGFSQKKMSEYARANVAHAIAPLQAEIEALRAEVSGLRAARIAYASEFPATADGDPDTGNIHANIRALKARAERLAEALQSEIKVLRQIASFGNMSDEMTAGVADRLEALLRDQEEGR